ncbi:MAG: helix-turn-helix domain-containing protein [Myxococcota bacterium]
MSRSTSSARSEDSDSTITRLPTFVTVDELAFLLRVNRNTAYEAIARGEIPGVVRIGRKIRLCRSTVVKWLRGEGRVSKSSRRSR